MKVRRPNFTFRGSSLWTAKVGREFTMSLCADSLFVPHLEVFLNKTLMKARRELGAKHETMGKDVGIFIQQEGNHLAAHKEYNKHLATLGYDTTALAKEFQDEYTALESKGLKFGCAYAAAFESLGPIVTKLYFEECDDLWPGVDPDLASLSKWHIAEEFEHSRVCFDVYQALYGDYVYRVRMLVWTLGHLGKLQKRALAPFYERERDALDEAGRRELDERFNQLNARRGKFILPRIFGIASPFFHPSKRPTPRGVDDFLASFE